MTQIENDTFSNLFIENDRDVNDETSKNANM